MKEVLLHFHSETAKAARAMRMYAVLSQMHQVIVRSTDARKMFEEVCEVATSYGEYMLSWIGMPANQLCQTDTLTIHVGDGGWDADTLAVLDRVPWNDPAIVKTVQGGQNIVINELHSDLRFGPWRDDLSGRGCHSAAAVAISIDGARVGIWGLCAAEPGFFSDSELYLLDEMAEDISFALTAFAHNAHRKSVELEIQTLIAGLEQRIKERTLSLEESNRDLEAFAYTVSHDLRGPLRAIDGFGAALQEEYSHQLVGTAAHYLERMRSSTARMGQIIDDLMGLAVVAGADFHTAPVDLSRIAGEIVDELKQRDPGRKAEIVISSGINTRGDANLLRVALENMLGNAWKFTGKREHTKIEFGATTHASKDTFFVRDNGAGLDMVFAHKLFEPMQRLHSAEEFPGTGIGLATVKRIMRRHGGKIWVESVVGEGTTFYFEIGDHSN